MSHQIISHSVVGCNNVVSGNNYGTQSMYVSFSGNGLVTVNDQTFEGKEFTITVECDGQKTSFTAKDMRVKVEGDVETLTTQNVSSTEVNGDVGGHVKVTNGSLKVKKDIHGNAKVTNGNITVNSARGNTQVTNGTIYNRF